MRMRRLGSSSLIAAAILMAVRSVAAEAPVMRGSPGGRLALEAADVSFVPTARLADWSNRIAGIGEPSPDGRFTLDLSQGNVCDGTSAMSAEGKGIRAQWNFVLREEATLNFLGLSMYLPVDGYAAGTIVADGRTVAIPKTVEGTSVISETVTTLTFRPTGAKAGFTITFERPTGIYLQDDRNWGMETFTLSISAPGSNTVAAGTSHAIALTVEYADADAAFIPPAKGFSVISRSDGWTPVAAGCAPEAGSALDLSSCRGTGEQAGAFGRVIASGDHFEFEKRPGEPVRFWGVNVCNMANFPNRETALALAERWARSGYNAIRLHHHDGHLTVESDDGLTFNENAARAMDGLVAACIDRGLYVTTDLFVTRPKVPWRLVGEDRDGSVGINDFKVLVLFHEGVYSNYLAYARNFLGRVNTYTGRRYADEPALAWLSLVNEGTASVCGMTYIAQHRAFIEPAWNTYLAKLKASEPTRYGEVPDGLPAVLWPEDAPQVEAFSRFLSAAEKRFARRTREFLTEELGCRALITDMNSGPRPQVFRDMQAQMHDFIDRHWYAAHPGFIDEKWALPYAIDNRYLFSAEQLDLPTPDKGKPFVASEFNWCAPSASRAAGGLYTAAKIAQLKWDGAWRFAWTQQPYGQERALDSFEGVADPVARATDRAVACLFLRGDALFRSRLSVGNERFTVCTARTVGGFAPDGSFTAGAGRLSVGISGAPATVWASALDGKPIAKSRRILLTHLTDVQNTGCKYGAVDRSLLYDWGDLPLLMKNGTAKVRLRCDPGSWRVHALAESGRRLRTLASAYVDGTLRFTANVAADPTTATYLYEICDAAEYR